MKTTWQDDLFFTPPHIVEYVMGTGNYLAKIAEQIVGNPPYSYTPDTETLRGDWPQIESTGNKMSIADREADAVRYIREKLERIQRELQALGYHKSADYCWCVMVCLEFESETKNLQKKLPELK
jgi:hypothetical protein